MLWRMMKFGFSNKAKNVVMENLKAAENWLKNEENIKKLIDIGIEIALVVLPDNGKAAQVLDIAKKHLNK